MMEPIEKPLTGEFPTFFESYIHALADEADPLVSLSDDLGFWKGRLGSLSADEASFRPSPGKWNLIEMTRHLADTELIFTYRLLCALRGEQQNLPGFDQNDYQISASTLAESLNESISDWAAVRLVFESLAKKARAETGHKSVRVNGHSTTARALVWIVAGHSRHHRKTAESLYLNHPDFPKR